MDLLIGRLQDMQAEQLTTFWNQHKNKLITKIIRVLFLFAPP